MAWFGEMHIATTVLKTILASDFQISLCYYTSVACPYFEPVKPRFDAKTLLPLGDFWSGVCHAAAGTHFEPDEHLLSECCNMGYARGKCSRFPPAAGADAVRFTISSDAHQMIQVTFAIEKNHHPHSQGSLEFSRVSGAAAAAHPDPMIEQQAEAYLASYLRRRPSSG